MQPTFIPWVGYFDLIDTADKFIFYDDVQFTKQSWQCRNRIKTANGITWLTVPLKKHALAERINQVEINNSRPWISKLLKTLFYNYQKAPFFKEVYSFIEEIFRHREYLLLSELTIEIILAVVSKLEIKTDVQLSSSLATLDGGRNGNLVNICQELKCSNYLSPKGSSVYIESEKSGGIFAEHDINLQYQNYTHPEYTQNYGVFEPYMSVIDLLFYEGFQRSMDIIRSGRGTNLTSAQL
ncbi:WbqC family protein [Cognaticolwellia mytili]|uniref:WbqC family protein n=1 Tax=Cognaticolwellia mytili TaxID=1888913 RepID=UPI00117FCB33|nr:WbqC family protein [Cognaticolwellia mytili]